MEIFFLYQFFNIKSFKKFFFIGSFYLLIYILFIYLITYFNNNLFLQIIYNYYFVYPFFNLFGLIIFFLSLYFSFIIIFLSDNKIYQSYVFIFIISLFPLLSLFYIYTLNLIIFFFIYELFLLPSLFLVYYLSPNKRSLIATFYFLIWTQLGSFFVFIYLIILISKINTWWLINITNIYLSVSTKKLLFLFIFLGFGIKVPIWPFYYWLTKTHVEAPTFFSIYLSGFLVKVALYGFYKLFFFFIFENLIFYLTILIFSVCDVSLKFFSQVDLKKLVAYSTVQEMNLIFIGLLWGSYKSIIYVSFFCLTHTLLSTIFFFLIDIIYKRYLSRSIYNITGIFINYPLLSLLVIFACLNYNGFPLSLKFFLEIFFFNLLFELNFIGTLLLLILLNWVGTVNFTYLWFRTLFGTTYFLKYYYNLDIVKKELLVYCISFYIFYQFLFFLYLLF